MDTRRTLTMNWDGDHDEDDDDHFFDPRDRFSSAVPEDLGSSGSDDELDDTRLSFSSAVSSANLEEAAARSCSVLADYELWMAEPGDVKERRRRLLQGMGLLSNKSLHKIASAKKLAREVSRKAATKQLKPEDPKQQLPIVLVRSRSAGDIESLSMERKEELIGSTPKQHLTRTLSGLNRGTTTPRKVRNRRSAVLPPVISDGGVGPFFLIKNLDTGNEFIIKENKSVGFSPVMKSVSSGNYYDRKLHMNSYLSRSVRYSKRRGVAILKNIKGVAHSMSGRIVDKSEAAWEANKNSSQWIKVRQHGKPYKEFTGLHLCQEIQAHEGSIWSVKFSSDAHYLASAGEDKVIHIWEVQECDVMAGRPFDDLSSVGGTPVHPMSASASACGSPIHPMAGANLECASLREDGLMISGKRKKGKKKGGSIPDYVIVPETVFALSEKPVCTLTGHQDVVLDLSWSTSQLLLSSSMDKTVRLWDVESQCCLKMFAHNDYVTCIQFNPVDDDYFISGSLDSKVRIWNITDRKVVDWTDQKEMVTATCYTPNGKGAMIGSHRGSCRYYSTTDSKLEQKGQFDTQNKKKSQIRKVTGFQYSPWNTSEVLISTADSSIRIHDGSSFTHKFKGFRNTSSQISASYSPDGKYVISASEDSQVYIWKREESKSGGGKGRRVTIHAHEHFPCKDVSVAIPWPGSINNEPPVVELHSKRHSKRFLPPQYPTMAFIGSPSREEGLASASSKRHLPPLPKKKATLESLTSYQETDSAMDDHTIGNHHAGNTIQATAWGMVIVTASLGGEIRVYQNFGLPIKVSRQTNLFRDLT